jgi:hypothetical protein
MLVDFWISIGLNQVIKLGSRFLDQKFQVFLELPLEPN